MQVERGGNFGDLKKFNVKLNGDNIIESVLQANVYQDVFAPTNTAAVVIRDTNNLLMNLPIRPGSKLEIEIETDLNSEGDGEQTWEMIVYRIGDKSVTNSKDQQYVIYAADEAFIKNQTERVWKSYRKKTPDKIASNVVSEFLGGELDSDDAENSINAIMTGWTPFYAMSWLQKIATKSGAADFVFFQGADGKFKFKSFEELYTRDGSGITFKFQPTNIRDGDFDTDYSTRVTKYEFDHFDALTNLSMGFYKNKLVTFDFIDKKWEEFKFSYGDDCGEDKSANKIDGDLLMAGENTNISFMPRHPGMIDQGIDTYLDFSDEWQMSRKSSLLKFEQEKLLLQIPGSAGAAEWFGKNCDVDLPSQDYESGEDFDKQRRGKYLITAMKHAIGKDTYVINMELVKKRLEE